MKSHSYSLLKRLSRPNKKLFEFPMIRVVIIFLLIFLFGTCGYVMIEGWRPFDAFYMTLITISTIGFGEVHPLSEAGRAFTTFVILGGVGNAAYAFASMTEFFASGGWQTYRRRSRMEKTLARLDQHTIICGFGRLGSAISEGLLDSASPFVVIERDDGIIEQLKQQERIPYVQGDATADEVLIAAGILRARALVAALDDDANNVFLTLTARVLNPAMTIYGKADDPSTLLKLRRAGADHQFSPALVAGHRVARQIVRPAVMDLVELATQTGQVELAIEAFAVERLTDATCKKLSDCSFWGQQDYMILAIRTEDGSLRFPPRADYLLSKGDSIIIMGPPSALLALSARTR